MRQRLENRRYCETWDFSRGAAQYTVSYGRAKDGSILELFINAKSGSDIEMMMSDFATSVSVGLQNGAKPAEIAKSLSKEPNGTPATPLGIIMRDMVKHDG